MNKNEFLNKLERSLSGKVPTEQLRSDVSYYENYINSQVRNGRSESDVLTELGEPRLIAKSIIDAYERNGGNTYADIDEPDMKETKENMMPRWLEKAMDIAFKIPGWLWAVIIGTLILLVLAIAASLISVLLPVLLPALCVLLVWQVFRNNKI